MTSITTSETRPVNEHSNYPLRATSYQAPLQLTGILNTFEKDELTPIIGREYVDLNIVDDLLNHKDADARIRELAITSKDPHN